MNTDWMKDPRVASISPEKLAVMTLLMEQAKQKTPEQFFSILTQTSQKLNQAGMAFTSEESSLLLDVLTQNLTAEEKQKLALIQSLLHR